ncbi:MAG: hypothetical protein ABIL00_07505 [candidate division WOR-3 bacterium]
MKRELSFIFFILLSFAPLRGGNCHFGQPLFWSFAYPFPIPTQFGAYYTVLEEENTIVPFANLEFGGFYSLKNSLSLLLRPGYAVDKGDDWLRIHAFLLHRWHLIKDEPLPYDHDALTLGLGLGGFAVDKTGEDGFKFGPAVILKFAGWTNKISWVNDLRGIFELEGVIGFLDEEEEGFRINKKATGIGATIGFWMPTNWRWLFFY